MWWKSSVSRRGTRLMCEWRRQVLLRGMRRWRQPWKQAAGSDVERQDGKLRISLSRFCHCARMLGGGTILVACMRHLHT